MKNIFRYGRHFLAAKGRHGTHSPFVYAFVEQVLRNKSRFYYKGTSTHFTGREAMLLARIIRYLQPAAIAVDIDYKADVEQVAAIALSGDIPVMPFDDTIDRNAVTGKLLILSAGNEEAFKNKISAALAFPETYALIVAPHKEEASEAVWNTLCALHEVQLRLDLWHFGLLVHDPVFKASQHFRLR